MKLVVTKPLVIECQTFKTIRTNTLVTDAKRELHARLIQNDCSYDESKPSSVDRNAYIVHYFIV